MTAGCRGMRKGAVEVLARARLRVDVPEPSERRATDRVHVEAHWNDPPRRVPEHGRMRVAQNERVMPATAPRGTHTIARAARAHADGATHSLDSSPWHGP